MATKENEMPNPAVIEINAKRPGERPKQVGRYTVGRSIVAKCRPGKWVCAEGDRQGHRRNRRRCSQDCWSTVFAPGLWRSRRAQEGRHRNATTEFYDQDKTVSVDELTEKLAPIIEALDAEGRKTAVTTIRPKSAVSPLDLRSSSMTGRSSRQACHGTRARRSDHYVPRSNVHV